MKIRSLQSNIYDERLSFIHQISDNILLQSGLESTLQAGFAGQQHCGNVDDLDQPLHF